MSPVVWDKAGHMMNLFLEGKWVVDWCFRLRTHFLQPLHFNFSVVQSFSIEHFTCLLLGVSWLFQAIRRSPLSDHFSQTHTQSAPLNNWKRCVQIKENRPFFITNLDVIHDVNLSSIG
jgi:hypothetical protein